MAWLAPITPEVLNRFLQEFDSTWVFWWEWELGVFSVLLQTVVSVDRFFIDDK
jgi:hypothetical protein